MHANSQCISCIRRKQEQAVKHCRTEEERRAYLQKMEEILKKYGTEESSPWLAERIGAMQKQFWDDTAEYAAIKHRFNQLLLAQEAALERQIRLAADPVQESIKYVCAGNYIDFGAVAHVSEDMLSQIVGKAGEQQVPQDEYRHFCEDLSNARTLAYLTDNCGEIVLDKIFMRILREAYPQLQITAIVRGEDTINDATMADAEEVGLTKEVRCMGNGNGCPGTDLRRLSDEAREALQGADVVVAKGQGNFESLYGEHVNPYFLFLCKCDLFVRRFGLKQFSSVFRREDRIEIIEQVE